MSKRIFVIKIDSCYGNTALVVGFSNEKWSNFVHLLKLLKHQLLYTLWLSINTICTQSVIPRSPNQHCLGCAEHLWAWSQSSLDTTLTDSSKQCHPARQLPYTSQNPSIVKSKPIRCHPQYLEDMTDEKVHKMFGLQYIRVYQSSFWFFWTKPKSKVKKENSKSSSFGKMHKITTYFEVDSHTWNIIYQVMNDWMYLCMFQVIFWEQRKQMFEYV